jgi:D-sedoheptulose 7-phosphate isomerase
MAIDESLVRQRLLETARLLEATCARAPEARAIAEAIVACYRQGGQLLLCGNGGSAADAQHIAGEMVGRFLRERAAWPATALHANTSVLTAIANDYGAEFVFSRQVEAMGRAGDVLWAISTSGNSRNCVEAMRVAKARGLTVVAMTGEREGAMSELADVCLRVPASLTPRVQEAQIALAHAVCELVEAALTEEG